MDDSPPDPAPSHSALGTAAFALGLLSFVACLGPLASLPALVLGIVALRRPPATRLPSGSNAGHALAGITLGALNLFLCAGIAVVAAVMTHQPPTEPARAGSELPDASAVEPPPGLSSLYEPGESSPIDEITEIREGTLTLVDMPPILSSLVSELRVQQKTAKRSGERMVLFVVGRGCRPCLSMAAMLSQDSMQTALRRTRLVRIQAEEHREALERLGIATEYVPGFYLLGPTLHASDGITGGEWDNDTAHNMAPVLRSFLRGTYTQRRRPFAPVAPPSPSPTRLPGTFL